MQATQMSRRPSPSWISGTLMVGAVLLFLWGSFVLGFLSEPSAVGRIWIALAVIGGGSVVVGLLGVTAAAYLALGARWAHTVALVASVAMILSVIGAIAGIPALIGLLASRAPARP